ncbi:hypothetical protein B0T17DRAFT_637601, partial [Bombardia bombarda]
THTTLANYSQPPTKYYIFPEHFNSSNCSPPAVASSEILNLKMSALSRVSGSQKQKTPKQSKRQKGSSSSPSSSTGSPASQSRRSKKIRQYDKESAIRSRHEEAKEHEWANENQFSLQPAAIFEGNQEAQARDRGYATQTDNFSTRSLWPSSEVHAIFEPQYDSGSVLGRSTAELNQQAGEASHVRNDVAINTEYRHSSSELTDRDAEGESVRSGSPNYYRTPDVQESYGEFTNEPFVVSGYCDSANLPPMALGPTEEYQHFTNPIFQSPQYQSSHYVEGSMNVTPRSDPHSSDNIPPPMDQTQRNSGTRQERINRKEPGLCRHNLECQNPRAMSLNLRNCITLRCTEHNAQRSAAEKSRSVRRKEEEKK